MAVLMSKATGNFTATLEVNDGVNPPVTSGAAVTVDNVAPTASLGNNGPIDEGGSATVSFSQKSSSSLAMASSRVFSARPTATPR